MAIGGFLGRPKGTKEEILTTYNNKRLAVPFLLKRLQSAARTESDQENRVEEDLSFDIGKDIRDPM